MKDLGLPGKEKKALTKIPVRMALIIKKIKKKIPKFGVRKLTAKLKYELPRQSWYPHYTTVHRFIVKNGFIKK